MICDFARHKREHKGEKICTTVLDNGFEYRGKIYRSLSGVAREATGTVWNGYVFYKLTHREQAQSEGGEQ